MATSVLYTLLCHSDDMDIGGADHPITVDEVREAIDLLIEKNPGNEELPLLGFVRGMLRHVECTCGPIDTGRRATVYPLRVGSTE